MGFKRIEPDDLLISAESVTGTVWTNNVPTLTTLYTSSVQVTSTTSDYFYIVYNDDTLENPQFDVTYCDVTGGGSEWYNAGVEYISPSRTMYGQYRTLILGDEEQSFVFGNLTSDYFTAISINRANYKEKLFANNFDISLNYNSTTLNLTTDASTVSTVTYKDAGRVFNIVSGSSGTVFTGTNSNGWAGGASASSGSYGWFLPDVGILIFNNAALDGATSDGGLNLGTTRTSNTDGNNPALLISAINNGGSFTLNSEETLTSNYIFVRPRNSEFNYSENPSYISGSTGELIDSSFINNPKTFITALGFFNDNNELLAVAKLSKPLEKDFTKELLIRTKLNF